MISDAEQQATGGDSGRSSVTYVHSCSAGKQATDFTNNLPKLMPENYQHYGARRPESAQDALLRVETFITNHQTCGDLVFEKRVATALITEDFLPALHTEVKTLWTKLESHTDSVTATSSCVVGDDRMYVFAVTPIRIRGFFRRNRHRANIFELADASGFMHIAVENI